MTTTKLVRPTRSTRRMLGALSESSAGIDRFAMAEEHRGLAPQHPVQGTDEQWSGRTDVLLPFETKHRYRRFWGIRCGRSSSPAFTNVCS